MTSFNLVVVFAVHTLCSFLLARINWIAMSNTTSKRFFISPCLPLETYFFDFTHDSLYRSFLEVIIGLNGVTALFSIASNFLVMCTIILTKPLRTPSNALLLGLAVSDFGVGIISQPLFCVLRIAELLKNVDLFCRFGEVFQASIWMLATVSFFTYMAITADRYMAVYLHLR